MGSAVTVKISFFTQIQMFACSCEANTTCLITTLLVLRTIHAYEL